MGRLMSLFDKVAMVAFVVIGLFWIIVLDEISYKIIALSITILFSFIAYKRQFLIRKDQEFKSRIAAFKAETARLQSDFVAGPFTTKKIGGSGYEIADGRNLDIGITHNSLIFIEKIFNLRRIEIAFDEINEIEISGPGKVTSTAGVIGGGFGLEGFLQGAVAAAIINAATTKSSVNTFVRVLSTTGEVYLHSSSVEPLQLKMQLSPIFVRLSNRSKITNSSTGRNVASELEKIRELFQSGILSQSEFETAKRKILS